MKFIDGYPYEKSEDIKYSHLLGRGIRQTTMIIPGGGCAYYRAMKGNACTFCAFPALSREVTKGSGYDDYYGSWKLETEIYCKMLDDLLIECDATQRLAIFNGGSFFPNSELPIEFQNYVYQKIKSHPCINQLFVEAYPSFISKKKLESAISHLGNKTLMIGIGLESSDDIVRNNFLKKGIDKSIFEKKIEIMKELGIKSSIYVFLKPYQLTEKQAYDDVIETLTYLSGIGVDEIALSCAFVSPGTQLENIYDSGNFRPPWLWTILKIMEKAKINNWPLSVGGFDDTPPPKAKPSNCNSCDNILLEIIEEHRKNNKFDKNSLPLCSCHSTWRENMENTEAFTRIL